MFKTAYKKKLAFATLLLSFVLLAAMYIFSIRDVYHPLHRLQEKSIPYFSDDLNIPSFIASAKHQEAYLKKQDQRKKVLFGDDHYTYAFLLASVQALINKLEQHPDTTELNSFLHNNYTVYQAGGRKGYKERKMLVTGYYEPVFEGSLIKKAPYLTPLYSRPDSLVIKKDNKNGKKRVGRFDQNKNFINYWSRAEIENNNLLKANELVYLKNPFDAYLLHVQGSGRIQLPDNSIRTIRFAASNGLEYNSIGKLLVDEGIMSLDEVNIPAIRTFLRRHPEQQQRILHHNPRYIFFNWGDTASPKGSSGEELTPGRSIAIDSTSLPGGSIGYLVSRKPVVASNGIITGWTPLNRFVFPQDSGSAIQGTGRVDVFWGTGIYAKAAANHMKEDGKLFFLVKKYPPGTSP